MHIFYKSLKTIAAAAALWAAVGTSAAQQAEKKYKDGEYDVYNQVTVDLAGNNLQKAIQDLDAWKQKFPDSDFKDDRTALYVRAYIGSKEFGKAVDTAADLVDKDLDKVFPDPKQGPQLALGFLFGVVQATPAIPDPTPQQLATGEKAAKKLLEYNRKPEGTSDADWNTAKNQLQTAARSVLLAIAIRPSEDALKKNDCDTAIAASTKALEANPDKSIIAYNLGRAYNCAAKKDPSKAGEYGPKAIYEFVRAAAIDPTLGGTVPDGKKISDYAASAYSTFHGGTDGLDQLKEQAKGSPMPPAGFTIETANAVLARKEAEFKEKYPQLAMWMGIKGQLSDPANGMQYFEGQLKNAAVPKLKGTVIGGACRAKEIQVAVPRPDDNGPPQAEITLKLDAPLTGKPDPGEIQWEGVPSAFSQNPFMLTMDTEKSKIEGLKVSACAAAPARARGGARKGASKKK
jgi:hypothetical protein